MLIESSNMNIITIDKVVIKMVNGKFGTAKHEFMRKKIAKIIEDEHIVTTESITRYCNCTDGVARHWLQTFEREGLIVFFLRMKRIKIYNPTPKLNRNCGISSLNNQETSVMMSKCLKVLREATSNPEKQKAAKVYNWATHLQGETIKNPTENYYMTEDAKRLEFMLKNSSEAFIGVIGLQGIGKTRLLEMLAKKFENRGKKTLFFRWLPNWQELLKDAESEFLERNAKTAIDKLPYNSNINFLSDLNMIFIDLPDYNKKNRDAMSKDLRSIESLWKQVADCKKTEEVTETNGDLTTTYDVYKRKTIPTLVLGIQKEMYGGHFFLGKMIPIELSPMKPKEMLENYKSKWETTDPFTEEALLLIAELSRGIFRRYLKYIRKSIEAAALGNNNFPISTETINKEITTKQLVDDMNLELTDLFQNNREHKEMAVKTLHLLREKQANQKEIADYLNVDEATASRLVKKLETYNYIRRQRGLGTEWLITLT
jgi:hypothetical protein